MLVMRRDHAQKLEQNVKEPHLNIHLEVEVRMKGDLLTPMLWQTEGKKHTKQQLV